MTGRAGLPLRPLYRIKTAPELLTDENSELHIIPVLPVHDAMNGRQTFLELPFLGHVRQITREGQSHRRCLSSKQELRFIQGRECIGDGIVKPVSDEMPLSRAGDRDFDLAASVKQRNFHTVFCLSAQNHHSGHQ